MRQKLAFPEGDTPMEKEEVTGAQLTCWHAKVQTAWHHSWIWVSGGFTVTGLQRQRSSCHSSGKLANGVPAVELPGAVCMVAWAESCRMSRAAYLMLETASAAVLDRYTSEFQARVAQAAQDGTRCRNDFGHRSMSSGVFPPHCQRGALGQGAGEASSVARHAGCQATSCCTTASGGRR